MIGVQIGGKNGKPLLREIRGLCLSSMSGTRPTGVHVGSKNGKPLLVYAPSLCDDAGKMEVGKNYVGVQIGGKNGKPLLAGFCEVCDDGAYSGSVYGSVYGSTYCPPASAGDPVDCNDPRPSVDPGGDDDGDGFCCRCSRFLDDGADNFPNTLDYTVTVPGMGARSIVLNKGAGAKCVNGADPRVVYTGGYTSGAGGFTSVTRCYDGTSSLQANAEDLSVTLYCMPSTAAGSYWACFSAWSMIVSGTPYNYSAASVMKVVSCSPKLSLTRLQTIICVLPADAALPNGYLWTCSGAGGFYDDHITAPFTSIPYTPGLCFYPRTTVAGTVGASLQQDIDEP